ncbi:MAG TPA: branched-chain amino acid ABC transporter permease [Candidatus Baltobacteraceae bacterium]|nr:branched-chain amino acid ABC transporter permease [Candidatus Baltobacteraceae bacterium]
MTARELVPLGGVVLALALLALLFPNPVALDVLFFMLLYAVLGQAWNWIGGFGGQVSFGQALFFGCGAYASAFFSVHGLWPWLAIPAGALVAVTLAVLVGVPCFALRKHYFSIATIAVAAIAEISVRNLDVLGGSVGIEMPIRSSSLANLQFAGKLPYVALALALFAGVQFATIALRHSRAGYYLRAIRANQEAAASIGIDARRWKLLAFAAGACVSAAAGSLYAQSTLFVDPESVLSLSISIAIALVGVVGGVGSVWGPALGAAIYVFLSKYVAALLGGSGRGIDLIIYGGLIVLVAALRPNGLVGAFAPLLTRKRSA